jgi:hypothetical protein
MGGYGFFANANLVSLVRRLFDLATHADADLFSFAE